ncbi:MULTISPECIES: hypothetical protein [Streptomyces]|uniref:hypothetical protein n=1 Tax=Streptomyces TaxID=1883 RepID=UPI00368F4B7C
MDDPQALEAVGRGAGNGMWGRWDEEYLDGSWRAFTTDPVRRGLAWCVRYHPEFGRSVLLVRDEDAASFHTLWHDGPLLFRSGGYWWDGTTWYRPLQVWDAASETYSRRPVESAVTVLSEDLLQSGGDPSRASVLRAGDVGTEPLQADEWKNHLALWAEYRAERKTASDVSACVVGLTAPELATDVLVGLTKMAELAGMQPVALRRAMASKQSDVPQPQAVVGGRRAWSRPVIEDWLEQRFRSTDSVVATMASKGSSDTSVGVADLQAHFSTQFMSVLWNDPEARRRWARRHRNEDVVREVSDELAWHTAAGLDRIVPPDALSTVIRLAVMDEIATSGRSNLALWGTEQGAQFFGLLTPVTQMLDWLIRHRPDHAHYTISGIIGEAERRFQVPRAITVRSLRTALALDGQLPDDAYERFFQRALPPDMAE